MATYEVRYVSIPIERPPAEVYAFASEPRNLPRWASGLSGDSIEQLNGEWVAESPMGKVRIRFAEQNVFGILDHDVTLESGATVHNPMRVVPNGDGSEVVFTLFQLPGVTDEAFDNDGNIVANDLLALKRLLEAPHES